MTIIKSDIDRVLLGLLGNDILVEQWWYSSNKAFDLSSPREVYLSGEEGRKQVYDYVMGHAYGR